MQFAAFVITTNRLKICLWVALKLRGVIDRELLRSDEGQIRNGLKCFRKASPEQKKPGTGFYDLAAKRGRDVSNKMRLWISELHKVHDCWANAM